MQHDDVFLGAQIGCGTHHQNAVRVATSFSKHLGLIQHERVTLANACGIDQYNFSF